MFSLPVLHVTSGTGIQSSVQTIGGVSACWEANVEESHFLSSLQTPHIYWSIYRSIAVLNALCVYSLSAAYKLSGVAYCWPSSDL